MNEEEDRPIHSDGIVYICMSQRTLLNTVQVNLMLYFFNEDS